MSEIQHRMLSALSKLPEPLQEKALIRIEATADAVEQITASKAKSDSN